MLENNKIPLKFLLSALLFWTKGYDFFQTGIVRTYYATTILRWRQGIEQCQEGSLLEQYHLEVEMNFILKNLLNQYKDR
jgi:cytochrome c oxidase assembly factor CtaG